MQVSSRDTSYESTPQYVVSDKAKLANMEKSEGQSYVYNSKTREFCGRTFSEWSVAIYGFCFAAVVVAYFGMNIWVFYQTLDNYTPKLQTTSSFIGANPGLGFRPMRQDSNPYSSLIWFKHGGAGDWKDLKENLDNFLAEYEPGFWANAGASQTKCSFDRAPLEKDEACEFNKEWLSDQNSDIKCISEEYYGYFFGKPCLLLKLNRVYGWQPIPYTISQVQNNTEMPKTLRHHITKTWEENCKGRGEKETNCPELNMVWLHCDGENDADKENIGSVSYTPWRGFPTYFFPYYNQLGYLQPIVMVQLKNPTPGVLINIQCTAWANFIEHDSQKMRGSVHIEFLMD